MGIDWENILGTSGAGMAEVYDDLVAEIIYARQPILDDESSSIDDRDDDALDQQY